MTFVTRSRIPPGSQHLSSSSRRKPCGRECLLAAASLVGFIMSTTLAAMPAAMTAPLEPRAEREPTPPPARRSAAPWQDWLFERTTMCFALLVLLTLVGHHRRRSLDGATGISEVRARVLLHRRLGPGEAELRRARAHLRHTGDVGDRAADRRTGQFRHRAVPDGDVPRRPQASAGHRGRIAGGGPVDHLRHVGTVRLRAGVRRLRPADAHQDLR